MNRIKTAIDQQLRPQQAGFRPHRSCCQQIFTLRQIIDKCLACRKPILVNYIDFKKAFDCIHRDSLWYIAAHYGLPVKAINIIKSFYQNSQCTVKVDSELGEFFEICSGVRQGCVLSPLLFGIVMDWVMRRSVDSFAGIQWVDGSRLGDLDFADDVALLHESWMGMEGTTLKLAEEARKVGLQINVAKTKIMKIGTWSADEQIQIGTEVVETCDQFCYLGSTICNTGGSAREIDIRLGKANTTFARLKKIWKSKSVSTSVKVRLYQSLILSVLLYCAETWPILKATMKRLEAAHHRWLRQILNISWKDKVTNLKVRELTDMPTLEDIIRERRLRWAGHIWRMPNDALARTALNWTPAGCKRKPGRPRMDWIQTVKQDIARADVKWDDVPQLATDRVAWRTLTARCIDGAGGSKV